MVSRFHLIKNNNFVVYFDVTSLGICSPEQLEMEGMCRWVWSLHVTAIGQKYSSCFSSWAVSSKRIVEGEVAHIRRAYLTSCSLQWEQTLPYRFPAPRHVLLLCLCCQLWSWSGSKPQQKPVVRVPADFTGWRGSPRAEQGPLPFQLKERSEQHFGQQWAQMVKSSSS